MYQQTYEKWLESPVVDEATKQELRALANDEKQKKYRFIQMLDFGTAGLRGIMGAGLNMMNVSTYLQQVVTGAIIIAAVLLDSMSKKNR